VKSPSRAAWFFDHCETISDRNIERVKALGGGIAVQNRMAFQGEYFVEHTDHSKLGALRRSVACWKWVFPGSRHRRNSRFELQPVPFPLLAHHRQDIGVSAFTRKRTD